MQHEPKVVKATTLGQLAMSTASYILLLPYLFKVNRFVMVKPFRCCVPVAVYGQCIEGTSLSMSVFKFCKSDNYYMY